MMPSYRKKILELLAKRTPGATICPSEVLLPEEKKDKEKMEHVREVARDMVSEDLIEITQKGRVIDPENIKGPIRLRLKQNNS